MNKTDTFFIGILIGGILMIFIASYIWHKDTIKHNAAHYDSITGNWEWNK